MPGLVLLGADTERREDPLPPADNATVVGLREGLGPEGEMVAVRDKVPDSPLTLVKVMLELEEVPGGTDRGAGLAETVKSSTWTLTWMV